MIRHGGRVIELRNVLLLRPRHTASRQFTIPREAREKYGIKSLDEIEIIAISLEHTKKAKEVENFTEAKNKWPLNMDITKLLGE
ncbi:hypothetical protein JCM16161A_13460 [Vulcanisaeta sp. JCM 16161]|uniref:AbrB/MazE/SpoVT family DNA-binding domain-containing protein n=1 Tax=Vulcanisaeta sp. JCM 16161 TaxID=1295372 RepID=UPI00406C95A8